MGSSRLTEERVDIIYKVAELYLSRYDEYHLQNCFYIFQDMIDIIYKVASKSFKI